MKRQDNIKKFTVVLLSKKTLLMEGSGSVQINYGSGCGSRRPKNIRISMRIGILNTGIKA
jgi:hypothetical protein